MTTTTRKKASELTSDDAAPAKPPSTKGFNADERAAKREAEPIVIGGQAFRRRRKDWTRTTEIRKLLMIQEREQMRAARCRKRLEDSLDPESDVELDDAGVEALHDEIENAATTADVAAYQLISIMLDRLDDAGKPSDVSPPLEFLQDELDSTDAGDLASDLTSGGEPDPTAATATT